jgi:catechol 2,3-dioxygenase-like lactoylglutathione lyase family enzyme
MLRVLATINYWTDDMEAAKRWYSELLGVEPYFERASAPSLGAASPASTFGFYSTGGGSAGTSTALNRAPRQATVSTPRMVISSFLQPNVRT